MASIALVSTSPRCFYGRLRPVGEVFDVRERTEARVLIALQLAADPTPIEAVLPEPDGPRYRRRDLTAEDPPT